MGAMEAAPARSMVLAALCFAAATVATIGAVYQTEPRVTLQSPGGAITELAPAPPPDVAAPGQ